MTDKVFEIFGDISDTNIPEAHWIGMPEYANEKKSSERKIIIHFRNDDDVRDFAKLLEQKITPKTKYLWYPALEEVSYFDASYVDDADVEAQDE